MAIPVVGVSTPPAPGGIRPDYTFFSMYQMSGIQAHERGSWLECGTLFNLY
jgi:hypothetical protein